MDADILLLQELDMFNKRTGDVDVCMQIAKALQMNYVYVVEYEELYSRNRTPELQGGGVHGSGTFFFEILTIAQLYCPNFPWANQTVACMNTNPSYGALITQCVSLE